jgi:uncharacterized protein (TIGR00299 family) protein
VSVRLAYFDCFSGVSGDMTLAALVGAGWPAAELQALPGRLGLEGVTIEVSDVRRGPFAAKHVNVVYPPQKAHRHLHHIAAILEKADLPAHVRDRALAVFTKLAEAEAEVHGSTVQKVHFHEVGAVDAIIDIAGAITGLDALGVTSVHASTLPLGGGTVMSEHGIIPVPAPATAFLLRGIPVRPGPIDAELVTPTGAALLATLVEDWGPPPPYTLRSIGTGAGTKDFKEHPNVLRLVVGDKLAAPALTLAGAGEVAVLETAIDDDNPQFVAALCARLIAAGALDAMLAPVTMKKGRAGLWLVVVAMPADAQRLSSLILAETTTLGVRVRIEQRIELPREFVDVSTAWGTVTVKVATLPDGTRRGQPEFESVRSVADGAGRPLREVAEAALVAWRAALGPGTRSAP